MIICEDRENIVNIIMNVIKKTYSSSSSNNRENLQQRIEPIADMCFLDLTTRGQNTHNYLTIATLNV